MDGHIHNKRIQVGTSQVHGWTHTQLKDTSGHITNTWMDTYTTEGHIHKYLDRHIHNRRIHVGTSQVHGWTHTQQKDTSGHITNTWMDTFTSIWTDTYTTEGYKWAHHKYMDGHIHNRRIQVGTHTQVHGWTHTQQKDTSGHIHKYMGGHIHNSARVSTCTTKGCRWAHIQVHG